MSAHNEAKMGDIAETILLPGDPLRAKYIADNFLEDVVCYNKVRNMLGFTGTYKGKRISVQGTGMGVPSISIYSHELITQYGVKNLIRIGTCGSFNEDVHVRDVILAMTSCTDSAINKNLFKGMDYSPCADFGLLSDAHKAATEQGVNIKVGSTLTSDIFYHDLENNPEPFKIWADYGVLAVEMEATALYTIAARNKAKALAILTVSDHILTGEETSAEERQTTLHTMIKIGLETAIRQ
ncbi:purine-nucleoside phosphorylase [Labilibaculum sp. A4]|uniref:Uridine phosphorylase n=2 Tax=Labilibaculum TaxID=2060722 RepID=A0A425Y5Z2_9BACT|nr:MULTISPECIES: purine-nucleoside phosphorylase [Labilibaculum]MBN2598838.1 purine-nucleoside phosphorylase [Marinifilaceae bacterium]MDQ1772223.1 purine-nucleoside phosphorylase [Labilibaculum euxinus]MUP39811.1 purine-nucleoside phosphorylase [Labilibaculum euxinus]MVB09016.1 purine-nucleoside phosphorylase [Labilibaculum euxinus]MWN77925.1 purine-nucleoside phosphorylase [Labilibaculum euxinus]